MQAFFIKKNKSTKWVCFLKQIPNFHFTPLIFLFSSVYSSKSTKFWQILWHLADYSPTPTCHPVCQLFATKKKKKKKTKKKTVLCAWCCSFLGKFTVAKIEWPLKEKLSWKGRKSVSQMIKIYAHICYECRKESIRKKSIRKKKYRKKRIRKKSIRKKNKSQFHVQRIDKRLCNVILINL